MRTCGATGSSISSSIPWVRGWSRSASGFAVGAGLGPAGSSPIRPGHVDNPPAPVPVNVLAAIVDSLAPAPADDPRLIEHAFDEDTVAHP